MNFDLLKVIDPHKHMPDEVKESFFAAQKNNDNNNGSYVDRYIGRWKYEDGDPDKIVEEWLLANFERGERVIILYWW